MLYSLSAPCATRSIMQLQSRMAGEDSTMNTLFEAHAPEHLACASMEFPVPGLQAAAEDLRAVYPELSDESLARILGLPSRIGPANHSVAPVCLRSEVA